MVEAILVKAFTKDKAKGNPAGVIFNADNLTDKHMVKISADLGFSESSFVSQSDKGDFKIRFFTPTQEVYLCGHATVATIHALMEIGRINLGDNNKKTVTIETKAGVLPIECCKDGFIAMTQVKPQFSNEMHDKKIVSMLLGISEGEISGYPIQVVSTGTPKLMIPIESLKTLFKIKPDLEGIKKYCQEHPVKGFYPFTFETIDKDSDFHARQFNPLAGIDEDPITGVAAGALGAYIVEHEIFDKKNFVIEQGYCMNKSGKMYVTIDDDIVKVGGYAVIFGKKEIEL